MVYWYNSLFDNTMIAIFRLKDFLQKCLRILFQLKNDIRN